MKTIDEKKYNHIELNNEVTKRKDNGFFNLEKDQEALAFYLEEIQDKTIYFDSEMERLHYLVDNDFYFDEEQYLTSRFEYAKKCQDEAVVTYALLKDGKWYQRGQMGWWGMASDEKDQDVWNQEFTKIVDSLPDDTMLTVVDCHI